MAQRIPVLLIDYGRDIMQQIERGNPAHIMLIEDEEVIRDMAAQMLKNLGYTVSSCASGAEAVDVYREQRDAIDLVILDMMMPGMDGHQTFLTLRDTDPDVRVLVVSGYSLDSQAQAILEAGAQGFIQKPYRMRELSEKLVEMLAESESMRK